MRIRDWSSDVCSSDLTNAIAPTGLGQVFAQLVNDVPGFLEMATASNPLKRAGDPENDIGLVVVFLASDMASFVNGELINVDGGQHLPGYVRVPHTLDELEAPSRSEERRGGKEGVSTCRSRWSQS